MTGFRFASLGLTLVISATLTFADTQVAAQEGEMGAPIVFFDIAGPIDASLNEFYAEVFGWNIDADGSVTVEARNPLQGTMRAGQTNENLLYFGVRDVSATLESVVAHGGTVDAPRFEVPGVVVLGLFRDPAGNRMGLVEIDEAGGAIIP